MSLDYLCPHYVVIYLVLIVGLFKSAENEHVSIITGFVEDPDEGANDAVSALRLL